MKIFLKSLSLFIMASLFFTGCQKDVVNNINLVPPIANAGNSHSIQIPPTSDTLRGTGTTTNGVIVGYLWSLLSGPNVPIIVSPSSPTTIIEGLTAGTYIFQFMVIDEAGLTGVDTVVVSTVPLPIQTVTLQPGNSPNELTMWLYTPGNYSDPASTELDAIAWTNGGNTFTGRNMFKFDLSSIPSSATIISAKLTLYSNHTPINGNTIDANFGTNNAMYIERVASNWTSTTLWQNQPSTDLSTQVLIPHTNLSFLDLIDVNVTNQVAAMKNISNYGFMIRLQNEVIYTLRNFCSSRYADPTRRPKLVISYQ